MRRRYSFAINLCAGAMALGLLFCLVLVAPAAAEFPAPNVRIKNEYQTGVSTDLREKNFEALEMAKFDAYFNEYFLLLLANPDAKPPYDLPTVRGTLKTRFLANAKEGPPYERLVRLSFDMMQKIINEKFPDEPKYEAVKFNAMLVIGDLNEREGELGVAKAKPLPSALNYMLRVVNSPKAPDYLRAPALLQILRHCEAFAEHPPAPELRKEVAVSMLKIVKQQEPPADRDASAHAWIRRTALQNLAAIGQPGAEGASDVLDAIVAVLRDETNPYSLRCAAAAAFSELKIAGLNPAKVAELVNQLVTLAIATAKHEIDAANEDAFAPRRIRALWKDIQTGMVGRDKKHGLVLATPEARRTAMEPIAKTLKEVAEASTPPTVEDLQKRVLELEKALRSSGAPPAVAPPAAAGGGPPAKAGAGAGGPAGATAAPVAANK